jgi:tetraacyldisaccharide 4'-kinase
MKLLKPKFWDEDKISIIAIILFPISLFIKSLIFLKNIFSQQKKFSIPILCVGNIYLGGTGKTPMCIELFNILKDLNKNPCFVRKNYDSQLDEVNLLQSKGDIYLGKNRIIALNKVIKKKFDIAILDDGFQDHSIAKSLSIICFNEKQWLGNGLTIPAGPLREDLSAVKRANIVIINGGKNIKIEEKILKNNQLIKIFYTQYHANDIIKFKNKKIISFAGIGNPDNFFNLLKDNNLNIIEQVSFPDHYNYSNIVLEKFIEKAKNHDAILLTTEKDYFRIDKKYKNIINYLKIKVDIENKSQFIEEVKKYI